MTALPPAGPLDTRDGQVTVFATVDERLTKTVVTIGCPGPAAVSPPATMAVSTVLVHVGPTTTGTGVDSGADSDLGQEEVARHSGHLGNVRREDGQKRAASPRSVVQIRNLTNNFQKLLEQVTTVLQANPTMLSPLTWS